MSEQTEITHVKIICSFENYRMHFVPGIVCFYAFDLSLASTFFFSTLKEENKSKMASKRCQKTFLYLSDSVALFLFIDSISDRI